MKNPSVRFNTALTVTCVTALLGMRPLAAQSGVSAISPSSIARTVRDSGKAGLAVWALNQRGNAISKATLDAVADTLVAVAIRSDSRNEFAPMAAVLALGSASRSGGRASYAGAAPRLLKIAENSDDLRVRGTAVSSIGMLPDRKSAISMLARIAQTNNPAALVAVQELSTRNATFGGLDELKTLFRNKSVTQKLARDALTEVAYRQGWK